MEHGNRPAPSVDPRAAQQGWERREPLQQGRACFGPSPHPPRLCPLCRCHSSHPGASEKGSKDLGPHHHHHHRAALFPQERQRQQRNKVPIFPAQGFSGGQRWGCSRVGSGSCIPPKAGTGGTCGSGYSDQSVLSTPCTGTGWWQ